MTEVEGYFRLIHGVEVAILYAREIELPEADWRPAVEDQLSNLEEMRDRLIQATRETTQLSEAARNGIIKALNDALEEARLVLRGGAGGSKVILGPDGIPVGPVEAAAAPVAARGTGGWASQLFAWLSGLKPSQVIIWGLTLVFGPPVAYKLWQKVLEPSDAEKQEALVNKMILADVARCGTDEDCKHQAIERGAKLRWSVLGHQLDDLLTGGSCGLLDTPIATVLGMLFGTAAGYAGMRSVMRL